MKDSLKFVGYVFMEIPSRILLADIFARTIYWRSSMQNPNLFVMVWEYFLEWITSWDNIKYFRTSYDAKMWIKQTASYSYLKKKPIFSENPFRWLYVHKSLCHLKIKQLASYIWRRSPTPARTHLDGLLLVFNVIVQT